MTSERIESLFMQCGRIHKDAEINAQVAVFAEEKALLQCGRIHKDAEIQVQETEGSAQDIPSMWPHP